MSNETITCADCGKWDYADECRVFNEGAKAEPICRDCYEDLTWDEREERY